MLYVLAALGGAVLAYVVALTFIHPLGRWWIRYWHGQGETHQSFAYACVGCHRVLTWRQIRHGGCRCGSGRIRPAHLSWATSARLLYLQWAV